MRILFLVTVFVNMLLLLPGGAQAQVVEVGAKKPSKDLLFCDDGVLAPAISVFNLGFLAEDLLLQVSFDPNQPPAFLPALYSLVSPTQVEFFAATSISGAVLFLDVFVVQGKITLALDPAGRPFLANVKGRLYLANEVLSDCFRVTTFVLRRVINSSAAALFAEPEAKAPDTRLWDEEAVHALSERMLYPVEGNEFPAGAP